MLYHYFVSFSAFGAASGHSTGCTSVSWPQPLDYGSDIDDLRAYIKNEVKADTVILQGLYPLKGLARDQAVDSPLTPPPGATLMRDTSGQVCGWFERPGETVEAVEATLGETCLAPQLDALTARLDSLADLIKEVLPATKKSVGVNPDGRDGVKYPDGFMRDARLGPWYPQFFADSAQDLAAAPLRAERLSKLRFCPELAERGREMCLRWDVALNQVKASQSKSDVLRFVFQALVVLDSHLHGGINRDSAASKIRQLMDVAFAVKDRLRAAEQAP